MSVAEVLHPGEQKETPQLTKKDKAALQTLVQEGVEVKSKMSKLQAREKEIKEAILPLMRAYAGDKQSAKFAVEKGLAEYKRDEKLAFGRDMEPVKDVLGDKFAEYFTEEVVLKPDTRKLKDLICDGDDALGMKLRTVTTLDVSESVSIKVN